MPVPASPSMSSLYSEFGAPAGTPLSAFLRGGDYIIDGVGTENIPETLPVSLLDFAGAFVPAALAIQSVQIVSGGTVTASSISDMAASLTLGHSTASGVQSASATAVVRVNIRVDRATTQRLSVTPLASNPIVQGVYRQPYEGVSLPPFDDAEFFNSPTGPFVQDRTGPSQGTWRIRPPCAAVGTSEEQRIADSTIVTAAAVAGGVYGVDFTLTHTLQAYIGGGVGFGQTVSRNVTGGSVIFRLGLIFRDNGTGALVQEIPLTVTVASAGTLQATAVAFAP